MNIDILNSEGKTQGTTALPEHVASAGKVSRGLVHEVVRAYRANQRKGTQSAMTRSEVSGSGKKPWKQKHTGRARAGTSTSPLWRGGGVIFAPKPRDYRIDVPKAKVKSALFQVINAKVESGQLVVSDKPKLQEAKTKAVAQWIKKMSLPGDTLLVLDKKDEKLAKASKNIKDFNWIECKHLHPYHLLGARKIVMTPEAIQCL